MVTKSSIIVAVLSITSFILAHEIGHFLPALYFNLNPEFVLGTYASASLSNLSIGVNHMLGTKFQEITILLGATILPVILLFLAELTSRKIKSKDLHLFAKIYLLLIILSLIPIPGMPFLDANRIWAALISAL